MALGGLVAIAASLFARQGTYDPPARDALPLSTSFRFNQSALGALQHVSGRQARPPAAAISSRPASAAHTLVFSHAVPCPSTHPPAIVDSSDSKARDKGIVSFRDFALSSAARVAISAIGLLLLLAGIEWICPDFTRAGLRAAGGWGRRGCGVLSSMPGGGARPLHAKPFALTNMERPELHAHND